MDEEFNKRIGRNIQMLRILRGMTQRELADALSLIGDDAVGVKAVSSWERGMRSVSALHIHYIAKVLEVSEQSIFDTLDPTFMDKARALLEAAEYSDHERSILRYGVLDWIGDTHALIEWIGMYMSLPAHRRAEAADYLMYIYEHTSEPISTPYTIDTKMIKQKIKILEDD